MPIATFDTTTAGIFAVLSPCEDLSVVAEVVAIEVSVVLAIVAVVAVVPVVPDEADEADVVVAVCEVVCVI